MTTTAIILGRTRQQVFLRIPAVHPHRILTLDASAVPGEKGDRITVEVTGPIVSTRYGWAAALTPSTEPAQ